jgi:putative hydrolase of the HAD superfamily
MNKIKYIAFDLGGVIMTINQAQAARHFESIGLKDAATYLNAYTQEGIFGDLELGKITAEEFRQGLSDIIGRNITLKQCQYAWLGYRGALPVRNLDLLLRLRSNGYRVLLLSNTNPFMMEWARSDKFSPANHPLDYYFNSIYLSYECKMMKPSADFFKYVLEKEETTSDRMLFVDDGQHNVEAAAALGINTFCPTNGSDWTERIYEYL